MASKLDVIALIILAAGLLLLAHQALHQKAPMYSQSVAPVREASQTSRVSQPRLNCLISRPNRPTQSPDEYVLPRSGASAVTGEQLACWELRQTAEYSGTYPVAGR